MRFFRYQDSLNQTDLYKGNGRCSLKDVDIFRIQAVSCYVRHQSLMDDTALEMTGTDAAHH